MASSGQSHELLPWLITGTLGPEEQQVARDHLDRCAECAAELEFLEGARRQLAEHGEALLGDHPSVDDLVATVIGERGGQDDASVRRHLALCPDCALEARWAREEASPEAPAATTRRRPWRVHPAWGWVAAAAAAAALFGVLLGPDGSPSRTRLKRPVLVSGDERSASGVTVHYPEAGASTVLLILPLDLPEKAFPLTLELVDHEQRQVFVEPDVGADRLQGDYLFLDCDVRECTPGDYTVRLRGAARAEPLLELRFRIGSSPEN